MKKVIVQGSKNKPSNLVKRSLSKLEQMALYEAVKLKNHPDVKGRNPADILMMIRFQDDHIHGVFPDDDIAEEMIMDAMSQFDLFGAEKEEKSTEGEVIEIPRRIVFRNRMAIGDILMFTCAVRDFKKAFPEVEVKVESTAFHLWDYNPHIFRDQWVDVINPAEQAPQKDMGKLSELDKGRIHREAVQKALEEDRPVKIYVGSQYATNASNRSCLHFANAFRIAIQNALGVEFPQGPIRPDLYMSEDEYARPPIIQQPYWLITAGEKGDWTCKTFPFRRWQQVIDAFQDITFVQLGQPVHRHPPLRGKNVINYIGKTDDGDTGIRDLMNLFLNCEGSMGLVSFQMHMAAAFNKPCVVIAGAREPVWFTRYPGQQYLATDGCLPCTVNPKGAPNACWRCDINACAKTGDRIHQQLVVEADEGQKVPKCADLVTAEDVISAIRKYYEGGRLSFEHPSVKSKVITVVKGISRIERKGKPTTLPVAPSKKSANGRPLHVEVKGRQFLWGGTAITDLDWKFIEAVLEQYDVKTMLEFGSGLSTLLMQEVVDKIVSYETEQEAREEIRELLGENVTLQMWDGVNAPEISGGPVFDCAFVDGPFGGEFREHSFKYAAKYADLVLVHDAGRQWEQQWQAKYLEPCFELVGKGGHRCSLWKRMAGGQQKSKLIDDDGKKDDSPILEKSVSKPAEIIEGAAHQAGVSREEAVSLLMTVETPDIRFYCNANAYGGGERSPLWMMNQLAEKGFSVELVPINGKVCTPIQNELNEKVAIAADPLRLKDPAQVVLMYCNDHVYGGFRKYQKLYEKINAEKKIMVLNYQLGFAGQLPFTKDWDLYVFLNSTKEQAFLKRVPEASTKVLPPPVDLTPFFDVQPVYEDGLRFVRHSSQRDSKWPKDTEEFFNNIIGIRPEAQFFVMPGPSWISTRQDSVFFKVNEIPIPELLAKGNCFLYRLPEKYEDQGPRVIMEAQAAGLPVICDNHSGPADRVPEAVGWKCEDRDHYYEVIKNLTHENLRIKGESARDWAIKMYHPTRWTQMIEAMLK